MPTSCASRRGRDRVLIDPQRDGGQRQGATPPTDRSTRYDAWMTSRRATATVWIVLLATACGGSGAAGSGTPGRDRRGTPVNARGIPLPNAVVAVPAKDVASGALRSGLADAGGPPASSDFALQPTMKVVAEPTLLQLEFLNTVLDALSIAHHDDLAVVNQGPYSVLVPWIDAGSERPLKRLARWVVDSKMLRFEDGDVNRVQLWPSRALPGDPAIPKVQVEIREPPRRNPDGSYTDYGVWSLIASFSEIAAPGVAYYAAAAERDATGASVVKFDHRAANPDTARRGVLVTGGTGGIGWFVALDGGVCTESGGSVICTPRTFPETVYAFDARTLTIQKGASPAISRDRDDVVDVVTRLGTFDAVTGAEAARTDPYSFSVMRPGADPFRTSGMASGAGGVYLVPEAVPGESIVAADSPTPREFTVSRAFTGNFVRVDLVALSLDDIRDNVGLVHRRSSADPGAAEVDYVVFDGARWLHKIVQGTGPETGMVAFDGEGYEPYDFPVGVPLRLTTAWMQYDVTRVDETTYDVRRVVETWAHPSNAGALVPEGVTLTAGTGGATYRFDTDPASPTFLELVAASGAGAGERVTSVVVARSDVTTLGAPYWLWRPDWTTHYLVEGTDYAQLGDSLCFVPIRLRTATGEERAYVLQSWGTFAEIPGWNLVLPRLAASGGEMTRDVARYVVEVPAGTEVVEYGETGRRFVLKPLTVEQHLLPSASTGLDLTAAAALRDTPLPPWVAFEPAMGPIPDLADAPLRYAGDRSVDAAAEP